jgi:hypothetical protein
MLDPMKSPRELPRDTSQHGMPRATSSCRLLLLLTHFHRYIPSACNSSSRYLSVTIQDMSFLYCLSLFHSLMRQLACLIPEDCNKAEARATITATRLFPVHVMEGSRCPHGLICRTRADIECIAQMVEAAAGSASHYRDPDMCTSKEFLKIL